MHEEPWHHDRTGSLHDAKRMLKCFTMMACHLIMPQFAPIRSHDDGAYQKPTSGGASSEGGRSDRSIQIIAELHPLLTGCSRQSVPCASIYVSNLGAIGTDRRAWCLIMHGSDHRPRQRASRCSAAGRGDPS